MKHSAFAPPRVAPSDRFDIHTPLPRLQVAASGHEEAGVVPRHPRPEGRSAAADDPEREAGMTAVTIRLAGEPEGKGRPRFDGRSGRAYTPASTRSYEAALRLAAQAEMAGRPLMTGALEVLIVAAFPIPKSFSKAKRTHALVGALRPTKKPDADNLLKSIDALNGVVWEDDAQVTDATVKKIYAERPELTIKVRPA
jgi:Holliday junction resolvase RusA-like endonuclease